ncbi:hypothetical protein [Clostridium tertium]|uniref:hypothetical protein n=1 Tax=Clostridium tertium TaxID=1559 RepID=UPI0023B2EE91|nr:hypothetical protein [Clostridium tertium]
MIEMCKSITLMMTLIIYIYFLIRELCNTIVKLNPILFVMIYIGNDTSINPNAILFLKPIIKNSTYKKRINSKILSGETSINSIAGVIPTPSIVAIYGEILLIILSFVLIIPILNFIH